MRPILYPAGETAFTSNGLGRLSDAVSCTVTEELNGAFELEMQYPETGIHAADITEGRLLLAAYDDTGDRQPFRICRRTDAIDGLFTVLARHIAYDLTRIPIMPYEANTAAQALSQLKQNAAVACPFTFSTDMTAEGYYAIDVPTSGKAVLGGGDGSIIGVYGGEVKYDRLNVAVLSRRGEDKSITIRYGKNMTGFEAVSEASSAYDAVVPFCKTQDGLIVCDPPVVAAGETVTDAMPLDLSDQFDYVPSPNQVYQAAVDWLTENQPWITEKAITVSFVALWQTEDYKSTVPAQALTLGDGVTVNYAERGINAQFRVVKTAFNVLADRYEEITLGREARNMAGMISELARKVQEARDIAQEIANGTYTGGTFINNALIYSPNIYGGELRIGPHSGDAKPGNTGGYSFIVDKDGNIETAGGMTAKGTYAVRQDNPAQGQGDICGYMGRAMGHDGVNVTYGVALCGPVGDPGDLGSGSNYVIVTDGGARMQAGGHAIWVSPIGAAYDGDEIATISRVYEIIDDMLNDDDNVNVGD